MLRVSFSALVVGLLLAAGGVINHGHAGDIVCNPLGTDGFQRCYTYTGTKGEFPEAGLTPDRKGNLYGTTFGALGSDAPLKKCGKGCGSADGLFAGGRLKILHAFVPGHGPMSTFGHERATNPFVGDAALAA